MALSPRTLSAIMQQETGDSDIVLMTVSHNSWSSPMRFSTHATTFLEEDDDTGVPIYGTRSRGNIYYYAPVQVVLPNTADEQPPEAHLVISNISRQLSPYLKLVAEVPPKVSLEVVNSNTPDIVEMSFPEMDFDVTTWDASTLDIKLKSDIASTEPVPYLRFSLGYFQNMES